MRFAYGQTIFAGMRRCVIRMVRFINTGITAMTIGAAKNHGRIAMHAAMVATGMAACATSGFFLRQF